VPLEPASGESWLQWLSKAERQFHHVGWHPISYWLGRPASLALVGVDGTLAASLLASPDRLGTVWLHLFAANHPPGAADAWSLLWAEAKRIISGMPLTAVWAMATQPWLRDLLKSSGFTDSGTVIAYCQQPSRLWPDTGWMEQITALEEKDLASIAALDQAAFSPPWQMDSDALRATLERSVLAAAFTLEDHIAGYLMAVTTPHGVHLTRLAVHPDDQNKGVGRTLIMYLLNHFHGLGAPWITVNTQSDNRRSRQLYRSMGFSEMQETYPVMRINLARSQ
jgi:ribosomal-protein-alanine N-acetyltransferase